MTETAKTTERAFLEKVYDVTDDDSRRDLYDAWAGTYDQELKQADYQTPHRLAAALKSVVKDQDLSTPVLDFGCGTGLSGEALAEAGFTRLHGADVSEGMLEQAGDKKVYEKLQKLPNGNPDPGLVSRYRLVFAAGSISPGAGPASCLPAILMALPPRGLLAVSYNSLALEDEEYMSALERSLKHDEIVLEVSEDGPHLKGKGTTSRVMVIRRT